MPRSHGRIASNAEIVAGRRNHSHLRRSLDVRNHRFSSEERQISTLVTEQSLQKECWFQPRDMKLVEVLKEEASISSRSKFLEERIRTLEQTAFVMATATVRKGNERSVNNHPDYNHFFSRW